MLTFKQFVSEQSEYLKKYHADKKSEKSLKDSGYEKTRERKVSGGHTKRDYSGSTPAKDGSTYNKYIKTTKDVQTGEQKGTESTYVKTTPIHNGITRKRLHTRKHANVNAAAKHLGDLDKYHKEND